MNTAPSTEDLLRCAVEAAQTGGNHALHNQHRRTEVLAHGPNHRMRFLATNGHIHADLKDLVGPPA